MQSYQEKLFYIANILNSKFEIAPINEAIIFKYECLQDVSSLDCHYMLKKLAQNYDVIKIIKEEEDFARVSKTDNFNARFLLELGKEFKALHNITADKNAPLLSLSYNNKRQLLLNDIFLLTTTRNNSINDRLLSYLIKNPNKTVSRQELEAKDVLRVDKDEDKDFYVFLNDVNIKDDLKKLFFEKDLSKHNLNLKNPVYKEDLEKQDMGYIDLKKLFK